jgi:Uma2 family endonuclease/mono/diheme cytochrome c family protein
VKCAGRLLLLLLPLAPSSAPAASPPDSESFERRVRPVLAEHCFSCHGPKKQMGGLRLDSRSAILKGGDSGPAVRPGDPEQSLLVRAVRRSGDLEMPPKTPLKADAVEALTAWVKSGAPWPADTATDTAADAWKRHWAFQPVRDPSLPAVKNTAWVRTSVDPFILARLEEAGLAPSAPADKRTLLRRSEPQPDACLRILPEHGGQAREENEYIVGPPELVVEVASSTEAIDLHAKRADYERAGVREYVVVALRQARVLWFVLRDGRFQDLAPAADGSLRSEVFPGLWLDPAALLRGDLPRVLEVLRQGLATPEHTALVARLGGTNQERR